MQKDTFVALRDALLDGGKHRAIKIAMDNGVMVSLSSDLVVWDDEDEIMVAFVADSDSGAYGANLPIRVICTEYEHIQFIMANTNVKLNKRQLSNNENLETVINNINKVVPISEDKKESIINWFGKIYGGKHELVNNAYLPGDLNRGKKDLVKEGPSFSVPEWEEEEE